MEEEKKIIQEIEADIQDTHVENSVGQTSVLEDSVSDHHTKKHIGIIILLTVLLIGILIIVALVLRPSQNPEDVLNRLFV